MLKRFAALLLAFAYISLFFLTISTRQLILSLAVFFACSLAASAFLNRNLITGYLDITLLLPPVFWVASASALIIRQDSIYMQLVLAVAAALVFIELQQRLSPVHHPLLFENAMFLSAAGIFYAIWSYEFFFIPSWWIVMVLMFASSFLLLWTTFYSTPAPVKERALFSLFLAFLAMELTWGLLFWPVHYITFTVVVAGMYYLAATLCRFYLMGSLTSKKIVFHTVFISLVECIALFSARWLPGR